MSKEEKGKEIKLAPRPDKGASGKKVELWANYFKVLKFPNLKLFQYNFTVLSSRGRKVGKRVRGIVFKDLKGQEKFAKCIFNGADIIYCSVKLPKDDDQFDHTLTEDGSTSTFKISIKYNKDFSLESLRNYISSKQGWDGDVQTCMTALNAYLSYKVRTTFLSFGRGVYPLSDPIPLSGGILLRRGFYQSLRAGWDDLIINVDVCSGMFTPAGNAVDVAAGFLQCRRNDLRHGINDEDRKKLVKAFKTIRFRVSHRGRNQKSIYTVDGLSRESADGTKFRDEENREITVTQFFLRKYGKKLEFGKLPCLTVNKNSYPLEICEILPDQPFKGDVTDEGRADMIKHTCTKPDERFRQIRESLQGIFRYSQDENLRSINMDVGTDMVKVEGRVLGNVIMSFNKNRGQTTQEIRGGRWNFVSQVIQDGKKLENWSILVLSGDSRDSVAQFSKQFTETLNRKGMNIVSQPYIVGAGHQGDMKQALMKTKHPEKPPPELILIIMKDRSSLYGHIKRIAETVLDVRTQCILSKNMRKQKGFEQFCVNVGLKINAKLGGKNCSLSPGQIPFVSDASTMVFGADVYHSGVTEQHMPSIAAVCASMDAAATIYSGRYSVNKQPRNETIEQLDVMVIELLKAFRSRNGKLPERILFYRDGVSEGQFRKVMLEEVQKMRDAFKGGYNNKPPKLTFVIVQKRHHTRFMPVNIRDSDRGNCRPGTVVDTGIVVKQEFDFFLQSHASLQGTGRPTHYRVLVDDNKFKADDFQILTNKLCYLNARCTSAISVVTPAYYAHLICNRARLYTTWQGTSSSEGSATCAKVTAKLSNLMYFV